MRYLNKVPKFESWSSLHKFVVKLLSNAYVGTTVTLIS